MREQLSDGGPAGDAARLGAMDVLVIGAGLAGLRAAGLAREQGHFVSVLEASECVGGRVGTDIIDGFRCDRGFQLLNPGYPEAKRALDLTGLDLHAWGRGVAVRADDGVKVLADPLRHPSRIPGLFSGLVTCGDIRAVYRWAGLSRDGSRTLGSAIDDAGFSAPLRRVVERFFAGVLGDRNQQSAASFARQLAWYFAKGSPAVPAQGMTAIAHQLAEPVLERIHFGEKAVALDRQDNRWIASCTSGEQFAGDRVVVAAGPRATAQLIGLAEPAMHSLTTWWFATEQRPSSLPFLHVDVRDGVGLVNTSVLSNICPSYAPAGQHLVQATAVGEHGLDDASALAQAADTLGVVGPQWRLLVRHDIHNALPAITPGSQPQVSALPGVLVAGDTGEASIQGALASGAAAARALETHGEVVP